MTSRLGFFSLFTMTLVAAATVLVRPAVGAPGRPADGGTVGAAAATDGPAPIGGWAAADIFSPFSLDYSGCAVVVAPVVNAAYEQTVMELVNRERLHFNNLPPLKRTAALDDAARFHSTDLGQDDYFNHDSYDRDGGGNLVLACGWATRVQNFYGAYNNLAENIAAGYTTPAAVMLGWMNSTGHKNNIMNTSVRALGVGYACCSGTYGRYWTQDFGRKAAVYPLVINREGGTTTSTAVSLYMYGAWTEMRLHNDTDPWGAWQTFSNDLAWTLPAGLGTHTVYAEMRTGGTSTSASDSITLVSGSPTATPTSVSTGAPPPTATGAATATATRTATATQTSTPVPPTATRTNTAVPPTAVPTPTANTAVPPTAVPTNTPTATRTNTAVPPTAVPTNTVTATRTNTAVPPTGTAIPSATAQSTSTATRTSTPIPPTAVPTSTPTATRTSTAVPPSATPLPSATVASTNTATRTATPISPTAVPTNTPTATRTNTAVPPTATLAATSTPVAFTSVHDGFTDNVFPTQNFGALTYLFTRGGGSSIRLGYFKFVVTGLTRSVQSATLRLFVADGTAGGGYVYRSSNDFSTGGAWTEGALNWGNQPTVSGAPLSSFGTLPAGPGRDFDVTTAVTGNGTVSLLVRTLTADQAEFGTHEATVAEERPSLIVVQTP